jgi:hypothetical protein
MTSRPGDTARLIDKIGMDAHNAAGVGDIWAKERG